MTTSTEPEAQPLTDEEIARALTDEPEQDETAPYGRFQNGKPRKYPKPGNGRKTRDTGGAAPRRKPSRPRPKSTRGPDYEGIVGGLLQALSLPLMAVSPLDVVAIADHGQNVAAAAAVVAAERPEVAGVLDKLGTVGPYSILIGACTPLFTQVLTNHGVIPPMLGAVPRERMRERAAAMFAQMRGQAPTEPAPAA